MEELSSNKEEEKRTEGRRRGFWKRQFQPEATRRQATFDWAFGFVLPVACFAFDPIVFKSVEFGRSLAGFAKPAAYLLSFFSIMALAAWLIWGKKMGWLNALLAGLFATAGIISLAIGIGLFPLSLIGLMILIGIMGFTPLFTAFVFFRNAMRAFSASKDSLKMQALVPAFVLGAVAGIAVPLVVNSFVQAKIDEMNNGDAAMIRRNTEILRPIRVLVEADPIARRYFRLEEGSEEAIAAREAYEALSGENIGKFRGID